MSTAQRARRTMPWWGAVAIGAGAAIVGLLPWLVTGMRLPLQNLWSTDAMPDDRPLAMLPFSQYAITLIIALLVVGGAAAGAAARALRPRFSPSAVTGIACGTLAVQLAAVAQTAVTVRSGLQERTESALYLAALLGVAVLSLVCSMLVLILIARAPRAGAVVGLSISALALGPWVGGLLSPLGTIPGDVTMAVLGEVRWVAPVLVGAAIAWGGVDTVGRVVAAVIGLALVWVVPALITAISSAAGSRVLATVPLEMLEYGLQVLAMASTTPALVLPPLLVTAAVAAIGLLGRYARARRHRSRSSAASPSR